MSATVTATAVNDVIDGNPVMQTTAIAVASGDKFAVVTVQISAGSHTISSITFDGNAMTSLGSLSFGGDSIIYGYYYDVSALGAGSKNIVVTANSDMSAGDCVTGAYVLAGAGTPTNWTTGTGTSTTLIDIAVTSAADGITIWAIAQDVDSTLTPNGGETEVFDGLFTLPAAWYYASGYYKASSGSTTTSNIAMDSGNWNGVGLFVPAAAGGGSNVLMGQVCT
jgi:hypothetical protein